jgi:hypothetical protein
MAMECIQENKEFLHLVANTHKRQYRTLIATATRAQLDLICGVIKNVIKGRINISQDILKGASAFKKVLEKIAQKCFKPSRRKLLMKYGRIIAKIIAAALPVILAICSSTGGGALI